MLIKLEYIWLDLENTLKSKTQIWDFDPHKYPKYNSLRKNGPCPEELPLWGDKTIDSLLKPVRVVVDPKRKQAFLVMCELLSTKKDNSITNSKEDEFLFGFNQKYTLTEKKDISPSMILENYYCSIGNVLGREIMEEHLDTCLSAGLQITNINAGELLGEWEYGLMSKGNFINEDDLWLSKYFLIRLCEKYDLSVHFHKSVSKEIIVDNRKVEYEKYK